VEEEQHDGEEEALEVALVAKDVLHDGPHAVTLAGLSEHVSKRTRQIK
jgi:hypothetical protein